MHAVDEHALFVDHVEACAHRILSADFGDLGDGFTFERLQLLGIQARRDDAFPAAMLVDVLIKLRIVHDSLAKRLRF